MGELRQCFIQAETDLHSMLYFSRWKSALIWLAVLVSLIIASPNFFSRETLANLPDFLPKKQVSLGLDLSGGSRLILQVQNAGKTDLETTANIMRQRLEELGYGNPVVEGEGRNQIRVEVPGLYDAQLLKDILTIRGNLSFRAMDDTMSPDDAIRGTPPADSEIVYSFDDPPVGYLLKKTPILTGHDITDAKASISADDGQPVITLTLDDNGRRRLADLTAQGNENSFAIVVDNQVVSAPTVSGPLDTSELQIEGAFDLQAANNMAVVLRSGALPQAVTVLEERTIASALGEDYASAAVLAALLAALVVGLFMVLSYGILGVIALVALVVNIIILTAVLSLIGASISLASIAGLVLTIGLAVDAHILIYERVREDRRKGYSVVQAMESGFYRALSTIVDANLTTLIAALVLFLLGSGTVHGFALTVAIGIGTTLFTTLTFTRLLIAQWVRTAKPKEVPKRRLKLVPTVTHIPFMRLQFVTLGISVLACAIVVALFVNIGFNYGIDFRGGSMVELQARNGDANLEDINERLAELNIDSARVLPAKSPRSALVIIGSQEVGDDAEQTVAVKLRGEFEQDYSFQRVDVVGPTVSEQLSRAGVLAVILSLIGIFIYVWFRFRWQLALGAVLSTLHDVVILSGMFIVFRMEFNLWSVAAILTIIGYSLNDTVVIYDRVRENLRRYKSAPLPAIIDASINQTLSRTLLTSFVTFLAHVPLYAFGGSEIRMFALALSVGIIVASYSSIFIAAPLLVQFGLKPRETDAGDAVDAELAQSLNLES
ncbi:protein translocase subunit SecDF [Brucella suis bv. 1]|uniref:Multifunctional fusion protein n=2 Tax=Brucella TaxID=234 RepID=A0AAI8E869_BRUSS|nr:protein translocase subunit SecDF [Brucella suis]EEH14431.1 protein-export membrane protein SecD [Brucella ceti str. Cudo]QOK55113.1 protein translocase subunit SecDF [Brucella suis bv. 1]PXG12385.1 protein translocase subunit SecDF [Brucella suis]QOK58040.1 protein translocase subunit SecDF [Brucella suis bv. 1]